jgi:hypothetical protein
MCAFIRVKKKKKKKKTGMVVGKVSWLAGRRQLFAMSLVSS